MKTPPPLPELARHWLPVTVGSRRLTHGFVKREKPGKGFRSLCKLVVLERLEDASGLFLGGAKRAPMCPSCSVEGDRRLAEWKARAGVPESTHREASPYHGTELAIPDDDEDDPYA